MRIVTLLIFFLLAFNLNAQVLPLPNGSFNLIVNDSTVSDMYYVTGLYNDYTMDYAGTDFEPGNVFWSNTCKRYVIDSIIAAPGTSSGVMKLRLSDPDTYGLPAMGIGAVMMETTTQGLPATTSNISDNLQSCIQSHFAEKVDLSISGASGLWNGDSLLIHTQARVAIGDTSGTKMLNISALYAVDSIFGDNMVLNGGFSDSLDHWEDDISYNIEVTGGIADLIDPDENGIITQDNLVFEAGRQYVIKLFLNSSNDGFFNITGDTYSIEVAGTGTEYYYVHKFETEGTGIMTISNNDFFSLDSVYIGTLDFANDSVFHISNAEDSTIFLAKQDGSVYIKKGINIPNPDNAETLIYDYEQGLYVPGFIEVEEVTASQGLTKTGSDIQLGGTVTNGRTVTFDGSTTTSRLTNTKTQTVAGTGTNAIAILRNTESISPGTYAVLSSHNSTVYNSLSIGNATGAYSSTSTVLAGTLLAANQNQFTGNGTGYTVDNRIAFAANVNYLRTNSSFTNNFLTGAGFLFNNYNQVRLEGGVDTIEAVVINTNSYRKSGTASIKTVIWNNSFINTTAGGGGYETNIGYNLSSFSAGGEPLYNSPAVTGNYAFVSDISGWKSYLNGPLSLQTTSNHASAVLDAVSTTQGVLVPRMTTTQKNAISSPATGLQLVDTNLDRPQYRTASAWKSLAFTDDTWAFSSITSTPATLAGYGITDGALNTRNISTSGSLTGGGNLTADRTLQLVNDNATPGNSKYYGTNGSGTKGFYDLPAGGSDLGTITNGFVPQALNDTLVNSMIFNNGTDNVAIGTSTDIDVYSRLYVFGGANGANIDARPSQSEYPQALVDLQSKDFQNPDSLGYFVSTFLGHYSAGAFGNTFGTSNEELGILQFNGYGAAIKSTLAPIQMGVGVSVGEAMRIDSDNSVVVSTPFRNRRNINAQSGTSYTLVLADEGKVITLNNGSAISLTVPQNSSVAFPIGAQIDLIQIGAGQVTVAGSGSAVVNGANGLKIRDQYGVITLLKIATDSWIILGDTEP